MSVVPAYRLGEVVWAKVTGYPRWPAVIAAIEPERDSIFGEGVDDDTIVFRVNFLAHPSHAYLKADKLRPYVRNQPSQMRRKINNGLKKAIIEANQFAMAGEVQSELQPQKSSQLFSAPQIHSNQVKQQEMHEIRELQLVAAQEQIAQNNQPHEHKPKDHCVEQTNELNLSTMVEESVLPSPISSSTLLMDCISQIVHITPEELLRKYKLDDISTSDRFIVKTTQIKRKNKFILKTTRQGKISVKRHRKLSRRTKKGKEVTNNNNSLLQKYTARKIFNYLSYLSFSLPMALRHTISMSFAKKIVESIDRIHKFRSVIQWLKSSNSKCICEYYSSFIQLEGSLYENQGDKLSISGVTCEGGTTIQCEDWHGNDRFQLV